MEEKQLSTQAKNYKCRLFPFTREDCMSMQEVKQNMGWGISAFNLPAAWQYTQGEGVVIGVIDSTPSWSPIICREKNTNKIFITNFEDFFESINSSILTTERGEEVKKVSGFQVWRGRSKQSGIWQDIKHVLRHPYNGILKRINLRGGLIDVTPNHSLVAKNGQLLDAKEVSIGDRLCLSKLDKMSKGSRYFNGTEDTAWFMGFWSAEGSFSLPRPGAYLCRISQKHKEPLIRCQDILRQHFNVHSVISFEQKTGMFCLTVSNKSFYHFVASNWSTKSKEKKVPNEILNAPKNIQLAYIKGYNLGDGHHCNGKKISWEFSRFTTKSQILACGLLFLISCCLEQDYIIHTRKDKLNIIDISLNQPNSEKKLKLRDEITKIYDVSYEGYVYDLETVDHTFGCGVGPVKIHNTGCDLDHPDLKANLLEGINILNPKKPPEDDNGHGSHITGTLVACNNDIGMVGVCPSAKVRPIKALDKDGNGNMQNVAAGIRWAADNGVDFIVMSLGAPIPVQQVRKAIQYAHHKGVIVFCAAGNVGKTKEVFYPGAYPETISIGAITENMHRADFSNTGKNLDFLAPGVDIFSTVPDDWYAKLSGTSQATPFACGVAALVKSYVVVQKKREDISLKTVQDYRKLFMAHTTPVDGNNYDDPKFYQGFGIIDPRKFVNTLK